MDAKERVNALERQNEALYRMLRQSANKDRKEPQSGSGYIKKGAEERFDRILVDKGGVFRRELRQSDPIRAWKTRFQTPYKGDEPAAVLDAILHDFQGFGVLVEPVDVSAATLEELTADKKIYRILLREVPGDYWECDVYSLDYITTP